MNTIDAVNVEAKAPSMTMDFVRLIAKVFSGSFKNYRRKGEYE